MIIANDENRNRVAVENADRETTYYCPYCDEPLINKAFNSNCVKPYFSHKQGTKCTDDWHYDMSEWHRSWQEQFPIECREVPIEHNGIKHRADVCVGKVIFEFQHSQISNEEIQARNLFYTSAGYELIWIFDANDNIKNVNGGSLDPCQCSNTDLQWNKRAIKHLGVIPKGVYIFLEYTVDLNVNGKLTPMKVYIKLDNLDPLVFQKTSRHILQWSFLRQFSQSFCSSFPEIKYPTVGEILFPRPQQVVYRVPVIIPRVQPSRYELVTGKNGRIYSRKRKRF
ncbi:MAG: hypothetical protein J1E81_06850 [Eubacterium sp.]|nr:hypothetical protein [Eubacterium sp.]